MNEPAKHPAIVCVSQTIQGIREFLVGGTPTRAGELPAVSPPMHWRPFTSKPFRLGNVFKRMDRQNIPPSFVSHKRSRKLENFWSVGHQPGRGNCLLFHRQCIGGHSHQSLSGLEMFSNEWTGKTSRHRLCLTNDPGN